MSTTATRSAAIWRGASLCHSSNNARRPGSAASRLSNAPANPPSAAATQKGLRRAPNQGLSDVDSEAVIGADHRKRGMLAGQLLVADTLLVHARDIGIA